MNQPVDPGILGNPGGTAGADFPPRSTVAVRHRLRHAWPGVAVGRRSGREDARPPLTPRPAHFPAKAKRVIFLFMSGGPSHVDLFDPKPQLTAATAKPLPFEMPKLVRTKTGNLLGSPFKFEKRGQSGIEVSELLAQHRFLHGRHLRRVARWSPTTSTTTAPACK